VGTAEVFRGNAEQGIRHLELAFAGLPEMPAVANNLAWALAHAEQPDLVRAEQLADAAIRAEPRNAEFRETRGIILAKLGKTKQAITDLESALSVFPKRQRIHQELAQLYQQLGDAELAAYHQALAAAEQQQPADPDDSPRAAQSARGRR
jgi:predicted Zn-dependent protease